MPALTRSPQRRHALDVTARTAAALVAGYAAAYAFAASMAVVLPFARADRVVAGTLLAFVVWLVVAVHAFAARSAWQAWWRPLLATAAMTVMVLALPDAGTRP